MKLHTKNIIFLVLIYLICSVISAKAKPFSNHTENISIKADDVSFSLPTLSAYLSNLSITEKSPVNREILNLKSSKFSLEFIRSIFLWRFHVDSFKIDNMNISLLKDEKGEIHFFNKSIPKKEIQELFGDEKDDFDKKNEENGRPPELYFPHVQINNVTILCSDHDTRKKLWSIDNIFFEIQNLLIPPEKNKKICKIKLSADFNCDTNSSIYLSIASRTIPENPFINFNLEMENVDGSFLNLIDSFSEEKDDKTNNTSSDSSWFLFSNEFDRVINTFEKRCEQEAKNPVVSNFFSSVSLSNMIFDFNCNLTVSNHIFYPGKIRLTINDTKKIFQELVFDYLITNSHELLQKM